MTNLDASPTVGVDPRPLPPAPTLRRALGPGVILVAGALGSGELIIWPSLSAQFGLGLLWLAVLAVGTQYFINMEIARYTLATGEAVTRGLAKMWKPWLYIIIGLTILPYLWPGWAAGGATLITFAFGGGSVPVIAACALIAIALALTLSPVVYQTLEKVQMVFVAIMVVFIVVTVVFAVDGGTWAQAVRGIVSVGGLPEGIAFTLALSAVGAAGAGGAVTLAYSNFLRDKQQGMAHYAPRIVSPFTGEERAVDAPGEPFIDSAENRANWKAWWKVTHREQLLTFFFLGSLGIIVMSTIAYSAVSGQEMTPGLGFLNQVAESLTTTVGRWFALFFLIVVASRLLSTNVTLIDVMGRVTSDATKALGELRGRAFSESKLYVGVVWAVSLLAIVLLFSGMDQPLVLLLLGTALNGAATFVFCIGILWLNRTRLPKRLRISGFRMVAMIWACLLYGGLMAGVLYQEFQKWF